MGREERVVREGRGGREEGGEGGSGEREKQRGCEEEGKTGKDGRERERIRVQRQADDVRLEQWEWGAGSCGR